MRGRARLDLEDLESLAEPRLQIPHYDRRKAGAVAAEVSMQLWRRPALDTDEQLLQRVAIGLGRVVSSGVFFRADKRNVADLIQRKVHLRGGGGGSARLAGRETANQIQTPKLLAVNPTRPWRDSDKGSGANLNIVRKRLSHMKPVHAEQASRTRGLNPESASTVGDCRSRRLSARRRGWDRLGD